MATDIRPARAIFVDCLKCGTAQEREELLINRCDGDDLLATEVRELLSAHDQNDSFLEQPLDEFLAVDCEDASSSVDSRAEITDRVGSRIGPYKLLQEIGEGGFGVVYLAEQTEPVRRKVALKIIKPGMDTKEVIARFEAERQALALMDHPNIAKVLHAGAADSGRPYFVMELVHGVPITQFCDYSKMPTRERLELFLSVCRALQHAHQKGIIHRDLKPSNIMITMDGDRPLAKVIDFGISKALSQQLTERTLFTAYGQIIGTPMYMSPEQAQFSAHDVDTRSDVYSLGVLLYELLTGNTPFDKDTLQKSGLDELRRIIREVDPPRPSVSVQTLPIEKISTLSEKRSIAASHLASSLRGELDWIIMKCLEKERARRYESVSALSDDIENYLNDEPVKACPPSMGYRFWKAISKHRGLLTAGVLVSLTLLVGFVVSLQQAIRATNAESLANERLEAEQAANQEAKSERDRAEQNLQLALEILDRLYLRTAENELNGKTALTDDEREFLQQILPFYEALTEQQSSSTNSRVQKAHAYYRVGLLYRSLNIRQSEKTPQAESAFVHAIGLYAALVEEFPESAQYHHNLAQSHFYLAASMRDRKPSDSESHFLKAIEIVRGTQKQFPAEATHLLGDFLYKYGLNLWIAWERPHDAIVPLKESLIYREELLKSSPDSISFNYAVVQSLITLGNAHRMSNDHENANICYKNAIDHCDRCVDSGLNSLPIQLALGKAHRNSAMLGTSSREDNFHLGQTAFEKALSFTPSSIETRTQFGAHLEEYALYLESQKRFEDAEEFWRKSVGVLSSLVSDFPHKQWQPVLVSRRKRLVQLLANLGRKDEARAFVDEISVNSSEESMYRSELYIAIGEVDLAMADLNKADELPADNLGKANWRKMRGDLYANDLGEFEKALFDYDEWIKSQGEEVTAESYRVRAEFLAAKMKRYGAAVDDFTRAIELEPNNPELYKARAHEVWVKTRQYDKAVADCDKVIELRGANAIAHDYLFRGLIKGADLGQIDTGLADVEKALEIDPGYADAWGRKGQILVIANRNKEALSAFREMAQLQGYTSWHIWKRYATLAFDEGEVAEAVAALRAALERNPDDHSTLTWLGAERFVKVQKPANKKALLELADHAVVLTGKDDAGVRASRAAVYSFLGRTDFAEEEFDFAIESLPSLLDDDRPHSDNGSSPNRYRETSDALNVTAYYYLLTGHMDLALKRLRQAVMVARNSASRFSHDPWITNNYTALLHELSFVERAVGNASEAEKSEQEFLERMFSASDSNLETTRALYERVLLELYNERLSAASERCQDMWRQTNELESQPSNDIRWALWTTVLVPDALADYSQAIKIARDQQKELPDSFDRQQILGGLLLRTGQFDEGRTHLSKAFTKSDDASSSKAYTAWLLSMTYGALGNPKAAKEWYDKATEMTKAELDPKVIPTWNRRFTLLILQREATERLTASGVLLPSTKE